MANSEAWEKIFKDSKMNLHNFDEEPFILSAEDIKKSTQNFKKTAQKETRILCKQDTRESRPEVFKENNLFILPRDNTSYFILKGEGYVDIPEITTEPEIYKSKLDFNLESSVIGNSEMQHLDYAYASSLIRTSLKDESLVLTVRGRKRTPELSFEVNGKEITIKGVQTEVDAGYEGKDKIVLIEAKNTGTKNTIIRQLFFPFKQWGDFTNKNITSLFFEKDHRNNCYSIWEFDFKDPNEYGSIYLKQAKRFKIESGF